MQKNRVGRISFLGLCLCAALTGCGLEQSQTYYYSPSFINTAGTGTGGTGWGTGPLVLTHSTANDDSSFLGYDVYYRVYKESDYLKAYADYNAIVSTVQDTNTYTPASALDYLKQTLKFMKIIPCNSDGTLSDSVPIFRVSDPASSAVFSIWEGSGINTDWYYTTSFDNNVSRTKLERGITISSQNLFSFNSGYDSSQADFNASNNPATSGDNVILVFFAVAYGYDISTATTILSFPTGVEIIFALNYQ